MQHQDWNIITFRKKQEAIKQKMLKGEAPTQKATISQVSNIPAWKVEENVDAVDGGKPLKYISTDDSKKITQARMAKKLTQKELACRLNMQLKDIQDMEGGKAIENRQTISKIYKYLNVTGF